MADAVTTIVLQDVAGSPYYVGHFTSISDGTGETAVAKVVKATINTAPPAPGAASAAAASLDIAAVRWNIQGFASVRLLWDHTTDDVGLVLSGNGYENFEARNDESGHPACLKDPRSAGGTGDIVLTSNGAVAGASYDITLWVRKNQA